MNASGKGRREHKPALLANRFKAVRSINFTLCSLKKSQILYVHTEAPAMKS